MTTWKPHPHWPCDVSDDGEIRSHHTGQVRKPQLTTAKRTTRYFAVMFYGSGKPVLRKIHQLVAETFLGPMPAPGYEVRHLNNDSLDNRLINLAWGTRLENCADSAGTPHRMPSHCRAGHEYTIENTAWRTRRNGSRERRCRTCDRHYKRSAYARRKMEP